MNYYTVLSVNKKRFRTTINLTISGANAVIFLYWFMLLSFFIGIVPERIYFFGRPIMNLIAICVVMEKKKSVRKKEILFLAMYFACGIVSSVFNHVSSIAGYVYTIVSSVGIAYILLEYKISRRISYFLYWYYYIVYLIYLTVHGWDMNSSFDFMNAAHTSRNYISVLGVAMALNIFIAEKDEPGGNKRCFYISVATFMLCVLGVGRAGILAGGLLLAAAVFHWVREKGGINKRLSRLVFVILGLGMILTAVFLLGLGRFFMGNFAVAGTESVRQEYIWRPYFKGMTGIGDVLFGSRDLSMLEEWGHLHSSYFMMHLRFGVFMTLLLVFLLGLAILRFWKYGYYYLAAVLLAFMLRAVTDPILGFNYCDSFVIYYIFEMWRLKKEKIRVEMT